MATTPVIPTTNLELRLPNAKPLTPDQHDSNHTKLEAHADAIKAWIDGIAASTIVARLSTGELDGHDPETVIRSLLQIDDWTGGNPKIEDGATRDQTGLEIVALLEALAGGARLDQSAIDGLDDLGTLAVGASFIQVMGKKIHWVRSGAITSETTTTVAYGTSFSAVDTVMLSTAYPTDDLLVNAWFQLASFTTTDADVISQSDTSPPTVAKPVFCDMLVIGTP